MSSPTTCPGCGYRATSRAAQRFHEDYCEKLKRARKEEKILETVLPPLSAPVPETPVVSPAEAAPIEEAIVSSPTPAPRRAETSVYRKSAEDTRNDNLETLRIISEVASGELPKAETVEGLYKLPPLNIPPREPCFFIGGQDMALLRRVEQRSRRGEIVNIMVRGPRGSGKTTLAREFAAIFKRPFYEINCGCLVEPEQWFGKDRLAKGETWYRMARFIQAMETPQAVILLDEANRPHPEVLNALFEILDWRRALWVDDLEREVRVALGVVFFATMNEGEEYIVNPIDAALRERFGRGIEAKPPHQWGPQGKREVTTILTKRTGLNGSTTDSLIELMFRVNRNPKLELFISIRQLLVAAEEVIDGASLRDAVMTSVVNHLEGLERKKGVLQVLQDLGTDVSDIFAEEEES